MRCPFVYGNGKKCNGHIDQLEINKADISIGLNEKGEILGVSIKSRYHVHLYCSERGNHAGYIRPHSDKMKVFYQDLPEEMRNKLECRGN